MEDRVLGRIVISIASVAVVGCIMLFIHFLIAEWTQSYWHTLIENHFASIVGLPMAAAGAFIVVALFRQSDGPIEFRGLGFEFKGASGQVAMWIVCFLAIAGAIKLCW